MWRERDTILAVTLMLTALAFAACNRGEEEAGGGGGEVSSDPGDAIPQIFSRTLQQVQELVASHPEPATLRPQLEQVKNAAIEQLVAIGRQVAAMSDAERAQVESAANSGLMRADISWMSGADSHYRPLDNDLANLIASFNTITQYAFFNLLCQQNAAEAQRLQVTCP